MFNGFGGMEVGFLPIELRRSFLSFFRLLFFGFSFAVKADARVLAGHAQSLHCFGVHLVRNRIKAVTSHFFNQGGYICGRGAFAMLSHIRKHRGFVARILDTRAADGVDLDL